MKKAKNVVLVSTKENYDILKESHLRLKEYIYSDEYWLIVPKKDLRIMNNISSQFNVICDFDVINESVTKELKEYFINKTGLKCRWSWYYQQFIKISAIKEFIGKSHNINEHSVIWDADTIPLKEIVYHENNKYKFFTSDRYHMDYFLTIKKLLNLDKVIKESFIGQSIVLPHTWFKNFINKIENNGMSYEYKVIDSLAGDSNSRFSEYETIGTFFYSNYNKDMELLNENKWIKFGNSEFGGLKNLKNLENKLKKRYYFINYEKWDKIEKNKLKRKYNYLKRNYLKNLIINNEK